MIYVITHKKTKMPEIAGYKPLLVGAFRNENTEYLRDDIGENISQKNENYCELTGLYWIWKNTDDDYKGLVHYRRFFGKTRWSNSKKDIYSIEDLNKILQDNDMIVTYNEHIRFSLKEKLIRYHCSEQIYDILQNSVAAVYPEYTDCFDSVMNGNTMVICNMMYCKKDLFNSYCEWLFNILDKVESEITNNKITYQPRLYGYLSERLLNVWITKNNLKCKRLPVINTEMNFYKRVKCILTTYISEIIFRCRNLIVH